VIENAVAIKDKTLVMLALDWAKAFDSISPEALMHALTRFGLPDKFLRIVNAIYSDRTFCVSDAGHTSEAICQKYGICQGCPLSPFLFGMLMTVLITDAKADLGMQGIQPSRETLVNELLYADDTLLIDVDSQAVEAYMHAVSRAGLVYGLSFNWAKLEALPINCACCIPDTEGKPLKQKDRIIYLGSLLCSDGTAGPELNRRLGAARETFSKLRRVWGHACINKERKLEIYSACVLTKLTYNLHALVLNAAEQRKLDAFHVRCLRSILRIPHSFYSRVSNKQVLEEASSKNLSNTLLQRQLALMHRLALRSDSDILRTSVFKPGSFELSLPVGPKKRGRPRKLWGPVIYNHAVQAAGSVEGLANMWKDNKAAHKKWADCLNKYCT